MIPHAALFPTLPPLESSRLSAESSTNISDDDGKQHEYCESCGDCVICQPDHYCSKCWDCAWRCGRCEDKDEQV